jgi:hypothetical protein
MQVLIGIFGGTLIGVTTGFMLEETDNLQVGRF